MHRCHLNRRILIVPCLFYFSGLPCIAGDLPSDLDSYILSGMEAWKIPGLSIAIVKDGKVVLAKGYGVRETGKPEKVDQNTIFAIGSASKAFTSAAIGMLVDRGKVAWDDHVIDHWPQFKMSDPWVTQEIRVSDLLANRSGLSELAEYMWYGTDHRRNELIERLAYVPITQGFRYQFQYRNVMFLAAGELMPRLIDLTWDEFVTSRIFRPLEMDRSSTSLNGIQGDDNVARPHLIDYQGKALAIPYRNIDNVAPAGSIMSTACDMANWVLMLAGGGSFAGETFLKPETLAFIERSQTPVSTVGPGGEPLSPPAELRSYALGWVTESYHGTRLVWHNGSIDGMSAWVGMAPDIRLGVAILSNQDDANLRNGIFYRIIDSYSGRLLSDYSAELLDKRNQTFKARVEAEMDWQALTKDGERCAMPVMNYVGQYVNAAFGDVTISPEDGQLVYGRTSSMALDLRCKEGNTFIGKYRDTVDDLREGKVEIVFAVDGRGVATGFTEGANRALVFTTAK